MNVERRVHRSRGSGIVTPSLVVLRCSRSAFIVARVSSGLEIRRLVYPHGRCCSSAVPQFWGKDCSPPRRPLALPWLWRMTGPCWTRTIQTGRTEVLGVMAQSFESRCVGAMMLRPLCVEPSAMDMPPGNEWPRRHEGYRSPHWLDISCHFRPYSRPTARIKTYYKRRQRGNKEAMKMESLTGDALLLALPVPSIRILKGDSAIPPLI